MYDRVKRRKLEGKFIFEWPNFRKQFEISYNFILVLYVSLLFSDFLVFG